MRFYLTTNEKKNALFLLIWFFLVVSLILVFLIENYKIKKLEESRDISQKQEMNKNQKYD